MTFTHSTTCTHTDLPWRNLRAMMLHRLPQDQSFTTTMTTPTNTISATPRLTVAAIAHILLVWFSRLVEGAVLDQFSFISTVVLMKLSDCVPSLSCVPSPASLVVCCVMVIEMLSVEESIVVESIVGVFPAVDA